MERIISFPQFLCLWNYQQQQVTPSIHIKMAEWLGDGLKNNEQRMLLLSFRNSGKSTVLGLYSAWRIYLNPDLRILVLSGERELAKKMVRNVRAILDHHIVTVRRFQGKKEQWAADQFTVNRPSILRDPSMLAKGIEGNVTGNRADLLIFDDVEVPNTCDTANQRRLLRSRIDEARYVLTPQGVHVVIGTPHTFFSIYSEDGSVDDLNGRSILSGYHRLEIPITDKSGRSNWPERFPSERIEAIRRETGPSKFASQMLLQPANPRESRFCLSNLQTYEEELEYKSGNGEAFLRLGGKRLVSASCWWDPAFGHPSRCDSSVIVAVFADSEGSYWLHRVEYMRHDPEITAEIDEATQLCQQVVQFARNFFLPAVTIETNGIGRFLPSLLRLAFRREGFPCAVREHVSSRNKELRIVEALEPVLAAGRLAAHRSIWQTPLIAEFREWHPGCGGRDDGLDALAGCLLAEPVRLPRVTSETLLTARRDWRPGHNIGAAQIEFSV
jgi:hypothetical protein